MSEMQFSDSISKNILLLNDEISSLSPGRKIEIVAVSKFQPADKMLSAYNAGLRHFGENRGQEVRDKDGFFEEHPDSKLSFIGVLQKNKIKYLIERCTLIQSLSSLELASYIDMQYGRAGRSVDVLIEINSSGEESKSGFSPEASVSAADGISMMNNLRIRGVMTIGPLEGGELSAEKSFNITKQVFEEIRKKHEGADILSMGMSDDYRTAIKCGSNMVRIGRGIFGEREKSAADDNSVSAG